MSFSKHAYRHALQQRSIPRLDYVWISDECLAGAFQRFLKCQRRHGSRVPGPLEANRRLAKRKNTAVARTGSAYDPTVDVGSLFGVNGSEHVRQWTRAWLEPLELFSYVGLLPESPKPLSRGAAACDVLPPTQSTPGSPETAPDQQTFEGSLEDCGTLDDIRRVIYRLQINLQRELAHSHMIFNHLCSKSISSIDSHSVFDELVQFLNDQTLNTTGAGNYRALVEHLVKYEVDANKRNTLLGTVAAAVELGLVPDSELEHIIRCLPDIRLAGNKLGCPSNSRQLIDEYRRIWGALRSCSVLRLRDLQHVLNAWFAQLLAEERPHWDSLLLAKELAVAYHESIAAPSPWIPELIYQCLRLPILSTPMDTSFCDRDKVITYITDLLGQLDPELASSYIIHISESLTFWQKDEEQRDDMLFVWRGCLLHIRNAQSLLSSRVWTEITRRLDFSQGKVMHCAVRHQIALRIWILSALRWSLRNGLPSWRLQSLATDTAILSLLKQFPLYTWDFNMLPEFFFSNLTRAIQELDVPCNNVLLMANVLLTKKNVNNSMTRLTFEKLEKSEMSLKDVAAHSWSFNATRLCLLASHVQMIGRIDVTDSGFVENMINMVEQNPAQVSELLRLLTLHTPLKIALAMAWDSNADTRPKRALTTLNTLPTMSTSPAVDHREELAKQMRADVPLSLHPQTCVGVIHLFAIRFATSNNLTAKKAYEIVRWLNQFLVNHFAPVRPSLARALYHCGVVRFHREGRGVSDYQYWFIMNVVSQFEDHEITEALDDGVDLDVVLENDTPL